MVMMYWMAIRYCMIEYYVAAERADLCTDNKGVETGKGMVHGP